jgi:hypothetical protein
MARQVFKFFRGSSDLCKKEKNFLAVNAKSTPIRLQYLYPLIFATITNPIRSIIDYSMAIVALDWSLIKKGGIEIETFSALTNKSKQANVD